MWHGDVARQTYGRILSAEHVRRLTAMAADSGGRLVLGRLDQAEPEAGFFPPMCVSRPADGSPLLTHEVFGPILSVVPVDGVDEAIRKYRSIGRSPLALYVFSEDSSYMRRVLESTSSGMVTVNDAGPGSFGLDLPFGGVGSSGIGAFGGRAGFEELSHHRAVLVRSTAPFLPPVDVPPPSLGKVPGWLFGLALRLLVTGFFPRSLRPVLKPAVMAAGMAAAWRVLRRGRGTVVWPEMLRWFAAAIGGVAQMIETTAQHPG
jgi:aldehyde dehydrogenase (NAD+)